MPPIHFIFGHRPHRPQIINQQITIQQPYSGMGLFGGYGCCEPYAGYNNDVRSFMISAQQLQLAQMQEYQRYSMLAYPMQQQNIMNQYAYLNQMQAQLPVQSQSSEQNSPEQGLQAIINTMDNNKNYTLLSNPEKAGEFIVYDKDANLIASGDFATVRDKLLEYSKEHRVDESSERIENEDVDNDDDNNNNDGDGNNTVRSQKIPSQWYKAGADKNDKIKGLNIETLSQNADKLGISEARMLAREVIISKGLTGCLSMKQIRDLTKELISYNEESFNEDGSFKEDFSLDNLAIPNVNWIKKNIIGGQLGELKVSEILDIVKTHTSTKGTGNSQYDVNKMALSNFRETDCKNVYYNDQTKTHAFYFSNEKKYITIPEVKQIFADGRWIDHSGKKHSKAELIELAERKFEGNNGQSNSTPDNSGRVDSTIPFQDDDE